jgi:hypothetical protein
MEYFHTNHINIAILGIFKKQIKPKTKNKNKNKNQNESIQKVQFTKSPKEEIE